MAGANSSTEGGKFKGTVLALCAGQMAALASVSAKLATSDEAHTLGHYMIYNVYKPWAQIDNEEWASNHIQILTLIIRLISVCGIILSNALMWTLFTKSLQCLSSIQSTITNTASNFLASAILGKLLFGEALKLLWWIGSVFILLGLILIHRGEGISNRDHDKKLS